MTNPDEGVTVEEALRLSAADGEPDPIVRCDVHGVAIRYSELEPIPLLALEGGFDVGPDSRCLLLPSAREASR